MNDLSETAGGPPYPWQEQVWQQLAKRLQDDSFPHAVLLSGPAGNGKYLLAKNLAKLLLCTDSDNSMSACGQCQSCHWFGGGAHPDFSEILPSGKSGTIKVDQIRDVCQTLALTSHSGGYQVGLVYPAEKMNLNAANSLLKSLEEPTGHVIYILVSHEPGQLPATIRSRCQQISLTVPATAAATDWLSQQGLEGDYRVDDLLAIAGGAPLAALALAHEQQLTLRQQLAGELAAVVDDQSCLVPTAEKWAKQDVTQINLWLLSWVNDMIKARLQAENCFRQNPDVQNTLQALNNRLDLTLLFTIHKQLLRIHQSLKRAANKQMLTESMLLVWIT